MNRPFVAMIVMILVLGLGVGGAFAGGVALGRSQGDESGGSAVAPLTAASSQLGQLDRSQLEEIRQRIASGEVDPQDLRQQFGGQQNPFGRTGDFGLSAGLVGTIQEIQGNSVTVITLQGPLQATVTEDTTIQLFTDGSIDDLAVDMRVTVLGQRNEDGSVVADSIVVVPEGTVFSGGGGFGDRQRDRESQSR